MFSYQRTANLLMSPCVALAAMAVLASMSSSVAAKGVNTEEGSIEFRNCMKEAGGITSEMRACLHTEYGLLDRQINITYKSTMKQLKTVELRNTLVRSQRTFIWQRDFDCKLKADESGTKGGTAWDLIYDDCRVTKVRNRIAWLKKVPANPRYLTKV